MVLMQSRMEPGSRRRLSLDYLATRLNQETVETPVVRSTTQAREGVTGHGVRYVLLISTAALVVLFAAIWLYYFH
jgi:hypothetical protein